MRKMVIAATVAATMMLAGCSTQGSDPEVAAEATQGPQKAEWSESFEEAEPTSEDNMQQGNPQANFGDELVVGDLVVAARFSGSKTMDETGTEPGAKVRLLEIQLKNSSENVFDASSSTLDSITTDEGSGRQLFDGSDAEPFFGQIGPDEKASVTLLIKLPKGAKTATATYTIGASNGAGNIITVNFTGEIKKS